MMWKRKSVTISIKYLDFDYLGAKKRWVLKMYKSVIFFFESPGSKNFVRKYHKIKNIIGCFSRLMFGKKNHFWANRRWNKSPVCLYLNQGPIYTLSLFKISCNQIRGKRFCFMKISPSKHLKTLRVLSYNSFTINPLVFKKTRTSNKVF